MYRSYQLPRLRSTHRIWSSTPSIRIFSKITTAQACHKPSNQDKISTPSSNTSILNRKFWSCNSTWKRARINTLRCLLGCTIGDFSAMWTLQSFYPELGMNTIMLVSILLKRGADALSWSRAARTAMGMSMVSMIAMEVAENAVDYHLTGGIVAFEDPRFWVAAVVSVCAGFLAPLPYNYVRLRKYGKACH
ncbi:uncharacterized protein N7484_008409 [Penicillium longicatenatum]|uniref:uncharacterized protein n=1 Tax=Penicillium longicatenatum TaxID=1561947 RepID=UPI0025494CC0|nr:uncharacterized protein N7484_008409 [Penicillium longicatenatum]KAJ5635096.1 hypothetical protein N7484_008409 [Penicillium longicatenatum]